MRTKNWISPWGWTIVRNARASADWPTVEGRITASEVEHSSDAEGGDSYTPHVTYTYQVNGRSYENFTIKFGETSYGSERTALEILARYPVGQAVRVHYDPTNPDRAVLEAGVSGGSYIVLSVGLIFVAVSLIPPPFFLVRYLLRR
ncbi:MAG TPA: DUF3592 domain-containing protein [Anaerolineales bacterium]|nr:DUF3592 domain-containing protein [Anaerolineales bacterium]